MVLVKGAYFCDFSWIELSRCPCCKPVFCGCWLSSWIMINLLSCGSKEWSSVVAKPNWTRQISASNKQFFFPKQRYFITQVFSCHYQSRIFFAFKPSLESYNFPAKSSISKSYKLPICWLSNDDSTFYWCRIPYKIENKWLFAYKFPAFLAAQQQHFI